MLQIRRILQLLSQGYSKRAIASLLHSSRHTIDDYTLKIMQTGMDLSRLAKLGDAELGSLLYSKNRDPAPDGRYQYLQSRMDYFSSELTKTGVTKLLLWEEYRKEIPGAYSYSQFCEHLADHKIKSSATMHFTHQPGEVLQIDFAGKSLTYLDPSTGEVITCPVLVCVLPFSGFAYVEALASARQEHLFLALGRCLAYLGGVPRMVLSDNMKQVVKKSNRYEPVFTELCEQWALHNGTTLIATRVGKPKDKPTVENTVHLAYMRIYAPLRDKLFYSLAELNDNILIQLDIHVRSPLQKRTFSRYDLFKTEEQPLLNRLPQEPFVIKHTASAKVQRNYHVTLGEDWHHYSVPYQYIGKQVKLIYDTDEVEVYLGLQRIAVHKRNYRKHGYTTLQEHMPVKHRKYGEVKGWDADYFIKQATELGECSRQIFNRILESRTFTEQTFNACLGLIRLSKHYGKDRFENACRRALQASRVNYRLIDNILTNNLDTVDPDQNLFSSIPDDHENLRGPQAYN